MSTHLADKYQAWKQETLDRFNQLKANEEELNRIFIDIYGLQDELTPEVADKDVTVYRIIDEPNEEERKMRYVLSKRDAIVSLLSYAVGCMLGRYSLDVEGLAFAGGEWDDSKYTSFQPDRDNVLPITDEDFFADDIVTRFVAWVKAAYGVETLETNLDFVADALGGKGSDSRKVIRAYFLNDFYKDHLKTYKKRPIYWLFDSGKANGFKALIYLHRYNEDTLGRLRVEYLHRLQRMYESAIGTCDNILSGGASAVEKGRAAKRKEKLRKQLDETRLYDQALAHMAARRIPLDLDDGVKRNYALFQGVEVGREGMKAVKVDLLAPI